MAAATCPGWFRWLFRVPVAVSGSPWREVPLLADPGDLVASVGAVWASEPDAGAVVRLDSTARRVVQAISLRRICATSLGLITATST